MRKAGDMARGPGRTESYTNFGKSPALNQLYCSRKLNVALILELLEVLVMDSDIIIVLF